MDGNLEVITFGGDGAFTRWHDYLGVIKLADHAHWWFFSTRHTVGIKALSLVGSARFRAGIFPN